MSRRAPDDPEVIYIPPGVRNVDPDPLGKRGRKRPHGAFDDVAGQGAPYNDASAPPGSCAACGGTPGGCAACWCQECGAPPGFKRSGCEGCALRKGFGDLVAEGRRARRRRRIVPGVCSGCGCTDDRACPGGCSWVNEEHTLCSSSSCMRNTDLVRTLVEEGAGRLVEHLVGSGQVGKLLGAMARDATGALLEQALSGKKRRKAQKPVKVAMRPRGLEEAPRRGRSGRKGT